MIYKEYGKTGKKVSVIGFGGMRFRREDYIEKAAELVRKASELGVNYFDTAPSYCDDKSEEIMGLAFKNMPNDFYVSTKSMVYSEPDADSVRRRIDHALKRMGVEKINFFHMWSIKSMEQYRRVIAPGGPYYGALKAKDEGLVDHICFSTHCNGDEIEEIVNDGYFEGMTIGYNIINSQFREKGLKAAYAKGMGVATMNPLGGGIIPRHADYFKFIKEQEEESVVQAALRFNISHKEISTALSGISSMKELLENAAVGNNIMSLSEEKLEAIKSRLGKEMDQLCTGCGYCKGCPVGIDIPKYMDAYNSFILDHSKQSAISLLDWYWSTPREKAKECIECGQCERKCTQKLPIIERLKFFGE